MSISQDFKNYLNNFDSKFKAEYVDDGSYLTLFNTGRDADAKSFQISITSLINTFQDIKNNISIFEPEKIFVEPTWRELAKNYLNDITFRSFITVQTRTGFNTIVKIISWATNKKSIDINENIAEINIPNINLVISKLKEINNNVRPLPNAKTFTPADFKNNATSIPKPFLLLAGISGTGKTRFVREQAASHRTDLSNYCLIPVRPDWHEPSDLLGYVSRIRAEPQYVVTELLCFVVAAWKEAATSASAEAIQNKAPADMTPYWLCLDEMNLAPVEQYFADYLAVLETRSWNGDVYNCAPLLKADAFNKMDDTGAGLKQMRANLKLDDAVFDDLWSYFVTTGIPLPPNLIVAGTVNMDETTHGFSRKVIDRAFTIDFGAFYPNDFGHYFKNPIKPKTLGFPYLSAVKEEDLKVVSIDPDGQKSIAFLNAINAVLKDTPFELAFRALNELLISLVCFKPEGDTELQAVWDDFLMTKVLPRIDGDSHKLGETETGSLLTRLATVAAAQCSAIWTAERPDLLRENVDATLPCTVPCRSKAKLAWMQERLVSNGFTSFWP